MQLRLLKNARFYTFNPDQPIVESLLIRDGRIFFAGDSKDLEHPLTAGAQVEDLGGAFVLPGITDSHIHLLEYGLSLQRVDCETASREECLSRVGTNAEKAESGEWVLGHGWNHNIWEEGLGNKSDLDALSSENPIYLTHKSLHSGWANSAAFAAANINKNSLDPKGGFIERDAEGEPTGIVYEGAMRLIENAIPLVNEEKRLSALIAAQDRLLSLGITTVHDFDIWECYLSLQEMERNGQLKIRVIKSIPYPMLDMAISEGLKSGSGSELLRIGWLKLFSDGALGPQTAAMLEPYAGSDSDGMLFLTGDDILKIGEKAMDAGISLAVHAIGDRANREVINGYAQLVRDGLFQKCALKPRVEHVQIITPEDVRLLAEIGITASMQPIHAVSDRDMADKYWGARCENAYAWKSVLEAKADLIFGSDAPVESPNPFWGLSAATTRTSPGNLQIREIWIPQQRLSLAEALDAYIPAPHASAGTGGWVGKIEEGFTADLVVLPDDIFNLNAEEITGIQPLATMSRGEWVFRQS